MQTCNRPGLPIFIKLLYVFITFDDYVAATHLGIRKTRFAVEFAVRRNGKKRGINVGYFPFVRNEFISAEVHFDVHVLVEALFDGFFDRTYFTVDLIIPELFPTRRFFKPALKNFSAQ